MRKQVVSIAMATFNGGVFLQQQLDSFVNQSHLPDELVVCDDGSRDDTVEMVHRFAASAPFKVEVHRNTRRLGFAKNFERAISLCSGDLIFLSDQDDVWFANKIEKVLRKFEVRELACVVVNDQLITDESLHGSGVTKLENILSMGLSASALRTGCCTTITRSWAKIALPIADSSTHDVWIHGLAELLGVRHVLAEPLQYYRRHANNASNWLASRGAWVSKFETIWLHGLKDATAGWQRELDHSHLYLARIREHKTMLESLGLEEAGRNAMRLLEQQIVALEGRIKIAALPRWRRGPILLQFLIDGGYGHFAGWKSAAKDFIR